MIKLVCVLNKKGQNRKECFQNVKQTDVFVEKGTATNNAAAAFAS